MLKSIKIDNKLIYYFEGRFFEFKGEKFEIISSRNGKENGIETRDIKKMVHSIRKVGQAETYDRVMSELTEKILKEKNNKL